jgi:hypothetical protein
MQYWPARLLIGGVSHKPNASLDWSAGPDLRIDGAGRTAGNTPTDFPTNTTANYTRIVVAE